MQKRPLPFEDVRDIGTQGFRKRKTQPETEVRVAGFQTVS
jgi:hypothetical protein